MDDSVVEKNRAVALLQRMSLSELNADIAARYFPRFKLMWEEENFDPLRSSEHYHGSCAQPLARCIGGARGRERFSGDR
jgi:hypothetical protein